MRSAVLKGQRHTREQTPFLYDRWLLIAAGGLLAIGILMVASSSTVISDRQFGEPFHYLLRQMIYLGMGLMIAMVLIRMPIEYLENFGVGLLLASMVLLLLVLVPGIGHEVNGSRRWLGLAGFSFQVSEFAKMSFIIYLAGYLRRREAEVRSQVTGFLKPMALIGVIAILLLKEPDFGATVVIVTTTMGMMFLAGVRLRQFAVLLIGVAIAMAGLAISSPYRIARLTTFLNPWANQFDSGYQLTQSLIAFGRGGWFGVGLGDSVQKLFYLPEAHTDFLFAVLAEELGLIGVLVVILLFMVLVGRALHIGRQAYRFKRYFSAYCAYGFGLWLGLQAMINIGVNCGVLPTKGLTLPLMSYGGSSMLINCMVIAFLIRIDYENRLQKYGLI